MGDMPIGQCAVCQDDLDLEDSGSCDICSQPFCWGYFGDWYDNKHMCHECQSQEERGDE